MIEIGIFEKTFVRPSFAETLDAVVGAGLRHIQLHLEAAGLEPMPLDVPPAIRGTIRGEIVARGLTVAGLSATYNMTHPDARVRDDGLARLAVLTAAAADLGASVLTLCTGTRDPDDKWRFHPGNGTPEAWADLTASMAAALALAEEHDVTLAIEPEPANVVRDARAARRLLDEMASDRLKVILDPANIVFGALNRPPADSLDEAFALLGDDIVVAHAKDVDAAGRFRPAGAGIVPWDSYVDLIRASPFDGPLILHSLAEGEVPGCVDCLLGAMSWVDD